MDLRQWATFQANLKALFSTLQALPEIQCLSCAYCTVNVGYSDTGYSQKGFCDENAMSNVSRKKTFVRRNDGLDIFRDIAHSVEKVLLNLPEM